MLGRNRIGLDRKKKRGFPTMTMQKKKTEQPGREQGQEQLIIGRNAVTEALRAGRPVDAVYIARGQRSGALNVILALARENGLLVKETDPRKLDAMCGGAVHQGVAAVAAAVPYAQVEDLFRLAAERGEPPFFIIADEVEDPHNLGALIRTAEAAGAHGLIVPKRRAAGLTYAVGKSSAGAVEYLPVARVGNLTAAMEDLKKRGVWIYGADMEGACWCEADLTGPVALVVGNEGRGLGRLVRESCDGILSLPMRGKINSLNASVAGGILMYEIARQRLGIRAK